MQTLLKRLHSDYLNSLILTFGVGISSTLKFLVILLASRALGPEGSADFYFSLFVIFFLVTLFSPLTTLAVKEISKWEENKAQRARQLAYKLNRILILSSITLLIFLCIYSAIQPDSFPLTMGIVSLLGGTLAAAQALARGILRAQYKFHKQSLSMLNEALVRLALTIAVLITFPNAILFIAAYIISIIFSYTQDRRTLELGKTNKDSIADLQLKLYTILPLLLVALAEAGFQNIDLFLVNARFNDTQTGLYGAASIFSKILTVVSIPFIFSVIPLTSRAELQEGAATRSLLRIFVSYFSIATLILLMVICFSETAISLLYGEAFLPAQPLVVPLAMGALAGGISMILVQALISNDRFFSLMLFFMGFCLEIILLLTLADNLRDVALTVLFVKISVMLVIFIDFLHFWKKRV